MWKPHFKAFCENLLTRVPHLHLWAASCKHGIVPSGWQMECFTRPLRCPPAVLKEVEMAEQMDNVVLKFGSQGVPSHPSDPPVKLVHHDSQHHSGQQPVSCVQCGQEVASFLRGLMAASIDSRKYGSDLRLSVVLSCCHVRAGEMMSLFCFNVFCL